ncbi:NERD domain-containing protein [Robertmurraya yapensis]|uniref:NERD domain-containing protein n=1 Tax=Bacillus yapensis TaxID=2492960 RepID=A0A3S0JY46_9BACI|nr:nuclease-related domain-containing protein [Bacillus yapensis]RTR31497.1 NERD domain-containing protein [Bacillus yapensis]TKS95721.1 NERD domain-containing protein [Bacillus yapensis]
MILKPRSESPELLILRALSPRKNLTEKEKQYYVGLEKGYEGEVKFDKLMETHLKDISFLNDLLLEQNNSLFQIDSLGCSKDGLYLFDIKNFEGDFIVDGETWKTTNGTEIKNPYHQLTRCDTLLRRYLLERKYNIPIKPYLIFINPHFTLYNAPQNPAIILPTQLEKFIEKLQMDTSNPGTKYTKLVEHILSDTRPSYPNSNLPKYEYSELRKGIFCCKCGTSIYPVLNKYGKLACNSCSYTESVEVAVLRSVKEFKLLLPERKVTSSGIYEWCNGVITYRTLLRILKKNLTSSAQGKATHYEN